ncbi:hypothetical protein [Flavobacterium sp. FlaQc-50]|uniref:hypothetical protein n=1 Tax=unclassified Flavobacterium TaxID=196869 RepID=UPI0037570EE5
MKIKDKMDTYTNDKKIPTKPTTKEYFKLAGVLLGIIAFFVWLCIYLIDEKTDEIQYVKEDYTTSKGIITKMSLYKGKAVRIKYVVNGKVYEESDGMGKKLNKEEGDSIAIKYSNKKPELMISEYNWDY